MNVNVWDVTDPMQSLIRERVTVDDGRLADTMSARESRTNQGRQHLMNNSQQQTRRILVMANRTCPCPALVDEVARRAGHTPTEVLVVAPALNSRLRHWVSDVDGAIARAQARVERAVGELRERGLDSRGEVGDSDPMVAITDALAHFPASEIVIATHPAGYSNWLERGLIENARARVDIPVTHLVSSYGLVQEGAPA